MPNTRGGGRYYGGHSRGGKRGGAIDAKSIKITVFTALILLACVMRFSDYPPLERLRGEIAGVIRTDSDYLGAVEVLGRAVTGQDESEENAIVVFGRKILGLEGDEATGPEQTEEAATEPGDAETDTAATPEQPETRQSAGDISGLAFGSISYPCEATFPVFNVSQNLNTGLGYDEYDDDTPNEPFEIPSPDSVDDTVYQIEFDYAAPAKAAVSSAFGYRELSSSGDTSFHHGVDLAVGTGTKVTAFAAGTVTQVGYNSVYGNYVRIEHADGFESMYAHLSKTSVKKGNTIKLGEKVGESGSSGNVTGPHLHFELRKDDKIINPHNYLSFE